MHWSSQFPFSIVTSMITLLLSKPSCLLNFTLPFHYQHPMPSMKISNIKAISFVLFISHGSFQQLSAPYVEHIEGWPRGIIKIFILHAPLMLSLYHDRVLRSLYLSINYVTKIQIFFVSHLNLNPCHRGFHQPRF